jgi:AraC-like DNA-binding protein/mannose-6-phosphate isomerase-like protein (cupin superfamily)
MQHDDFSMASALFQPFPMLPGRTAQVWRHQPAYRRPRHFHEEPEINIVESGMARIGIGDRVVELRAGELVMFEPGQDHALLEATPDLELFVMALRPTLAARAHGDRPCVFTGKIVLGDVELAHVSERALALGQSNDAQSVEQALGDLFAALVSRPRTSQAISRRAVSQLRASPNATCSELARRLWTAPAHLSREFHEDLGLTLVEYRARLRLMRFVRLADLGQNLGRAALEADFGSYAQCHRVFQRMLGCSPRDYFAGARSRVEAVTEPECATLVR